MRHLIPRIDYGKWGGSALTWSPQNPDEVRGRILCVQWLGLIVEIGIGVAR